RPGSGRHRRCSAVFGRHRKSRTCHLETVPERDDCRTAGVALVGFASRAGRIVASAAGGPRHRGVSGCVPATQGITAEGSWSTSIATEPDGGGGAPGKGGGDVPNACGASA